MENVCGCVRKDLYTCILYVCVCMCVRVCVCACVHVCMCDHKKKKDKLAEIGRSRHASTPLLYVQWLSDRSA